MAKEHFSTGKVQSPNSVELRICKEITYSQEQHRKCLDFIRPESQSDIYLRVEWNSSSIQSLSWSSLFYPAHTTLWECDLRVRKRQGGRKSYYSLNLKMSRPLLSTQGQKSRCINLLYWDRIFGLLSAMLFQKRCRLSQTSSARSRLCHH